MLRFRPYPRLRGLAALVSLLAGLGAARAEPFVYVPTVGENGAVEVVDVATDRVARRLPTIPEAHGLAVTPDGGRLVLASLATRAPGAAVEKPAGVSASDHAAHHGGGAAAHSGADTSLVAVLDAATGGILRRIEVPGAVHHVAVGPDGRRAALTHPQEGSVTLLDLDAMAVAGTVPVGENPNYAAFSPDGARLYVSVAGADEIAVLDPRTLRVGDRFAAGAAPEHLVMAPDGERLYVNLTGDGAVAEIVLPEGRIARAFDLGGELHGIALSDDGGAVIASVLEHDRVARIDLRDGSIQTVDLPPAPYHVAAGRGAGKVYVSSAAQPGLAVLDQRDLSLLGRVETGGVGHQMAMEAAR